MVRSRVQVSIAAVGVLLVPCSAAAQPPLTGRVELAGGVTFVGGSGLGSRDASLTGPAGGTYRLFSAADTLAGAAGVDARAGVSLSRSFGLEIAASYARPELRAALANDAEQAAPVVARERIQQFVFDGSLVVHLRRWTFGRRAVPFLFGGAGYLRDLHEGRTLAVSGQSFHVGGGVKYQWLAREGKLKGAGIRADGRALARRKGSAVDDRVHVAPGVAVGLFLRF